MLEVPLPPRGLMEINHTIGREKIRLARAPPNAPLSEQPVSPRLLFELVSLKNILSLYVALCVEKNVVLLSSQLSVLADLSETLLSLMYPFKWNYPYIPLAPKELAEHIMEAILPCFAGTHIQFLNLDSVTPRDNLVIFVVDKDEFLHLPPLPKIPNRERKKLKSFLKPHSEKVYGTREGTFKKS
eukprot:UN31310